MWSDHTDEESGRKCTNKSSIYACVFFVLLTFVLVIYSSSNGSISRLSKGFDDCGNICGLNNKDTFDKCGSPDKTKDTKTQVDVTQKKEKHHNHTVIISISHFKCVGNCPPKYIEVFNRCWQKDEKNGTSEMDIDASEFQLIAQDLLKTWPQLGLVCVIALVFSYLLLILFRYAIKYVIWIIYISFIVLASIGAIAMWILFAKAKPEEKPAFGVFAIILTIFAVVSILLLYLFRNRIRLVAALFKEASKALIDVPSIIFEPILTFIALIFAFVSFVFFAILIETSGRLQQGKAADGEFQATFQKDFAMIAAHYVNLVAFIWFTQFIFGCQHFVIAGTISKWYFTRDKTKLDSPVMTTFSHLIRFHLGSVCLGSMLITLVKIIKMIINAIKSQLKDSSNIAAQCLACFCSWIIEQIDQLMQYLVRNAYIIVAKDGTPFFQSGKKAFGLIFRNLVDVIALNQFGDLVLVLGRLFVVVIASFIGYELMNKSDVSSLLFPMLLAIAFSFLIAHCFVTVFEMTVDTVFICFCEDCEENDGDSKPFYMSPGLMKIMQELKETAGGQFNFGAMNKDDGENPHYPIMPQQPYPYPEPNPQQPYPQQPYPQQPYPQQPNPQQPYPQQPYPQQPYPPYPQQPSQYPQYPQQPPQYPQYPQ